MSEHPKNSRVKTLDEGTDWQPIGDIENLELGKPATIAGRETKVLWVMAMGCVLGSEDRQRIPVETVLVTRDGRIVLVSTPYPNFIR